MLTVLVMSRATWLVSNKTSPHLFMLRFVLLASVVLSTCTPQNLETYKEWMQLTKDEKLQYVNAVVCLSGKNSMVHPDTSKPVPKNLFMPGTHPLPQCRLDDFTYARMIADGDSHSLRNHPQYLPWHRVFLRLFDSALRRCGYKGHLPYWDISAVHAPDVLEYFGSSGDWRMYFPKMVNPRFGPLNAYIPKEHQVLRKKIEAGSLQLKAKELNSRIRIISSSYESFTAGLRNIQETLLARVSGDIQTFSLAPNDPIYYLIQRNTDRLWYLSQMTDTRITGKYEGTWGKDKQGRDKQVSVKDTMQFYGLSADITVEDALYPMRNALTCYQYA